MSVAYGIEGLLSSLMRGQFSSLTLSCNDENAPNYKTVAQWLETDALDDPFDWVSDESRERAIKTNRMWTLQWYPATPVGFYTIRAATLEEILEHLLGHAKEYT